MPFDNDLLACKAKCFWQADSLTATMLENLCGIHIYILYLYRLPGPRVKAATFR